MRKRNIIFASLIGVAVLVFVLSIVLFSKGSDTYKLTTIKQAYNVLSLVNEKDEIVIPIYSNNKKCDFVDKKKVANCSITDTLEDNVFKLSLTDITSSGNVLKISGEEFYEYEYHFTFLGEYTEEVRSLIDKAYLKIELKEKEVRLCIGSLSYYKVLNYGDGINNLDLVCLKAIVNELDDEKTIVGVVMGLKNNSYDGLTISNINLLDVNLKASSGEIKIINEVPSSTDDISALLGYEYKVSGVAIDNALDISLDSYEVKYLLVPLKRVGDVYTNRFGLQIDYLINGKTMTYYLDDFLYFKANQNLKLEDFEIFTYENN